MANTSWGTTLDVNGDGFDDIAVGAGSANSSAGRAYVYLGGATGLNATAATSLTGPDGANGQFGLAVASCGDVNGDGFADLIVGAPSANTNAGRVYLYLGSATGLNAIPAASLSGPDGANGQFGFAAGAAGDVNGDGFADLIVGANGANSNMGRSYVYLGSATGLNTTPATTLSGADVRGTFGGSVAGAGDVNGDGFADIVVGAAGANNYTGRVFVYLGSATGPGTVPTVLSGSDGASSSFGYSVASAGDVNGDGFADLVVGAYGANHGTGRAYLYLGGATGLDTSAPANSLPGPDTTGAFGWSTAGAGDVNGDGFADVVIGDSVTGGAGGRAYVYRGSATGLSSTPANTLSSVDATNGSFGALVEGAGDVDGDGFGDLIVGASSANGNDGRAYFYRGSVAGPSTTPATSLSGPDASGAFGVSVASMNFGRVLLGIRRGPS